MKYEITPVDLMAIMGFVFALAFLIAPADAYSITDMIITPADQVVAGDPVTAKFTLNFEGDISGYTFDPAKSLVIGTAIERPQWGRVTILDGFPSKPYDLGIETQCVIPGWDVAYLPGTYVSVNITLTGIAPTFESTSRFPVVKVKEVDTETGKYIEGTETVFSRTAIQKTDLKGGILLAQKDLETFKNHIAERRVIGVDVSAAEAQANDITEVLNYLASFKQENYIEALPLLAGVREALKNGEDALERSYTGREINRSRTMLDKADSEIAWFTKNESTKNYAGLRGIEIKRKIASTSIRNASEAMTAKDYSLARAQAEQGFRIANETYHETLALKDKAKDPLTPLKDNLWLVVIGGFAVIVGYLFMPKRRKAENGNGEPDQGVQESIPGTSGSEGLSPDETGRVQQDQKQYSEWER